MRGNVTGRVVRPDGSGGPAYLVYDNYDVLLKWNRSNYFASAVGILSDRIRGGADVAASASLLSK